MSGERKYELLEVLGHGGFGTVYRARFLGEGGFVKEVAVKVLSPQAERVAEVAGRLRDEARVLGLLRHRAIVGVDRLTQLDGHWAVIMEYVEGVDLGRVLSRGPMPCGPALEIIAEVAGALHAAWRRPGPDGQPLRLMHRDIKPTNIRLTPYGEVKVLDFGIARAEFTAREASTGSVFFGTPEFMSPERLDFSDGPEGDIYALGAVLYELVSGRRLGRTSAREEKHVALLSEALSGLRREGQVPLAVIALLGDLLAFEPRARPEARDVELRCMSLVSALQGEPLRVWSERMVPMLAQLHQAVPTQQEDWTGTVVGERAEVTLATELGGSGLLADVPSTSLATMAHVLQEAPDLPVPAAAHPGPSRWAWVLGALLGLFFVGGLGASALLIAVRHRMDQGDPPRDAPAAAVVTDAPPAEPPAEPPAATPPPDAAVTAPAAAATPPKGAASAATSDPGARSRARSTPGRSASTAATTSAAAPATSAPTTIEAAARVALAGDATSVTLMSGGQRYAVPGEVPAGSYEIYAEFPNKGSTVAGTVVLASGRGVTLTCSAAFGRCKVR